MRLIVSAKTDHPIVWSVTKLENAQPLGIQKLTLYQTQWNEHTDYVEKDSDGNITGMYANYFDNDSSVIPTDPSDESTTLPSTTNYVKITAASSTIKVGGSYKTLTAKIYDSSDTEITDGYTYADFQWSCYVGDEDLTDSVTWLTTGNYNQIKIKFPDKPSYLGSALDIKCIVTTSNEIIETTAQFELIA